MSEEIADWMKSASVGEGLDSDMKGDPKADEQKFLRFWMPADSEKIVIFLTEGDQMPALWEHGFCVRGNWKRPGWCTCLTPLGMRCPFCDYANKYGKFERYKGLFSTVIDTTKF